MFLYKVSISENNGTLSGKLYANNSLHAIERFTKKYKTVFNSFESPIIKVKKLDRRLKENRIYRRL